MIYLQRMVAHNRFDRSARSECLMDTSVPFARSVNWAVSARCSNVVVIVTSKGKCRHWRSNEKLGVRKLNNIGEGGRNEKNRKTEGR